MSAPDRDPADFVRLAACTQCDYDLRGLPTVRRCPECGAKFDRRTFVITGTMQSTPATPFTALVAILFIIGAGTAAASGQDTLLFIVIGIALVLVGLQQRTFKQRGGNAQLEISPEGVRLRAVGGPWQQRRSWDEFARAQMRWPVRGNERWQFTLRYPLFQIRLRGTIEMTIRSSRREAVHLRRALRRYIDVVVR